MAESPGQTLWRYKIVLFSTPNLLPLLYTCKCETCKLQTPSVLKMILKKTSLVCCISYCWGQDK